MNDKEILDIAEVIKHNYDVNRKMDINDIILVTATALYNLGYSKSNQSQTENEQLKARLEKAVELPCRQGDIVAQIYNNQIFEGVCTSFIVTKDNDIFVGTKQPDNIFEEVYLATDCYPMFYGDNAKAEAEKALLEGNE